MEEGELWEATPTWVQAWVNINMKNRSYFCEGEETCPYLNLGHPSTSVKSRSRDFCMEKGEGACPYLDPGRPSLNNTRP
jgi:hypothetical protein